MHHHPQARDQYSLRNDPQVTFKIELTTTGRGADGAQTRASIVKNDGQKFRYEVCFGGEFSATKPDFDETMYEDTALSLVRSQLESRVYRDTRMVLDVNSGLPRTETGVVLNWD